MLTMTIIMMRMMKMSDNIELTLDTDYAPKFSTEGFGEKEKEFNFIFVKYTDKKEPNDIKISIVKDSPENLDNIQRMMGEGYQITVLGVGTAKNTNITELMYGLNHPTRTLFRSGVNDLAKLFTEGDGLLKKSL